MDGRRLVRSETDRMIGGVAAGIAEYFGVDPTLVRIAAVVLAFWGPGVPLYLVLWLVVPTASASTTGATGADVRRGFEEMRDRANRAVEALRGEWPSGPSDDPDDLDRSA